MNRLVESINCDLKKLIITLVALGFIFCSFNTSAFDDDFGEDGFGDDFSGDTFDYTEGDTDLGDVVIIDDSVNIYDGGGRDRRKKKDDAAGTAIMGFMGGMVVNELMQDKQQPRR